MQSERREIKVLHVDDEPDFLLITKHNLEKNMPILVLIPQPLLEKA
ncbi:MAG TPA: hypothetical protein VMW67_01170 [Desulfobacteria bacterium]|nr:hypothetical protein [Desulfobacteria bacterium]